MPSSTLVPKDRWVNTRVDADFVAALRTAAGSDGVSMGEFIRSVVLAELKNRGDYPPRP